MLGHRPGLDARSQRTIVNDFLSPTAVRQLLELPSELIRHMATLRVRAATKATKPIWGIEYLIFGFSWAWEAVQSIPKRDKTGFGSFLVLRYNSPTSSCRYRIRFVRVIAHQYDGLRCPMSQWPSRRDGAWRSRLEPTGSHPVEADISVQGLAKQVIRVSGWGKLLTLTRHRELLATDSRSVSFFMVSMLTVSAR